MLQPVADLIGAAWRRGQIFVVTHSEALAGLLEKGAGATVSLPQKRDGATTLC